MTTFDRLMEPVMPILKEIEQERVPHFNETLPWPLFVQVLVYHFTMGFTSMRELVTGLSHAEPALALPVLPRSTLSQMFTRFDSGLLRRALVRLLATLPLPENPELALLGTIYLVDGSYFPTLHHVIWGKCKDVEGSSDEYAVPFENEIHEVFKTFHDDILIASRGEKSVSSRMGHGLMDNNPYAEPRYAQARSRMSAVIAALKTGDVETFGQICEDEAMTLHALMMTNSPWFTLLKPNTLKMIEILRGYREATKTPVFFSLDAGPNLHVLYPHAVENDVKMLITNELKQYCENGQVIFDRV